MLENRTVLAKTDLGREAVARRTHNLNPRQRAILISINGETTVGALSTRFGAGAPDAVRPLLESLVDQGLVEAVDAAVDAMPAAGDAGAPGADQKLARSMFLFSILYLFLVFAALIVEHAAGLHFPVGGF